MPAADDLHRGRYLAEEKERDDGADDHAGLQQDGQARWR